MLWKEYGSKSREMIGPFQLIEVFENLAPECTSSWCLSVQKVPSGQMQPQNCNSSKWKTKTPSVVDEYLRSSQLKEIICSRPSVFSRFQYTIWHLRPAPPWRAKQWKVLFFLFFFLSLGPPSTNVKHNPGYSGNWTNLPNPPQPKTLPTSSVQNTSLHLPHLGSVHAP